MKHTWKTLAAGCAVICLTAAAATAATQLKIATQAPEGSIWMRMMNDAKAEIETATAGEVKIKIYPGGIMGAEKDVLFKIRTGQLQGGGFMGYAIGKICPSASALMFPLVFRGPAEVDCVLDRMRPFLEDAARANGYEAMGWTEVGFSYAYSVKRVQNLDDLRATKVWGLDSPMLTELFASAHISHIPANITDVLTALQTGSLESVFGPPTAAVAVQWPSKIKYVNTTRLTYAIGGVFITSSAWATVPPAHRETVRAIFDAHCRALTPRVRESDREALDYMATQGVEAIDPTPEEYAAFEQVAAMALPAIKGTVFPDEAWDRLQALLAECRAP